jgi:hypothetical protein
VGTLGLTEEISDPDKALAKLATTHQFAKEGLGRLTQLHQAAGNLASQMVRPGPGGDFDSREELMAAIGVLSGEFGGNVSRTQTGLKAASRDLSKPTGARAATMKRLGIKSDDDFVTKIRKLKPLIDEAEKPGGPGAQAALIGAGFTLSLANEAIIKAAHKLDPIERDVKRARDGSDPKALKAELDRFDAENPDRKAQAQSRVAVLLEGEQNRAMQVYRHAAEARLRSRHEIDTGPTNFEDTLTRIETLGTVDPRQRRIDLEAQAMLAAEAKRVGVDLDKEMPDWRSGRDDGQRQRNFAVAERRVKAAGGKPPAAGPELQRGVDALRKAQPAAAPPAALPGPAGAAGAAGGHARVDASDLKDAAKDLKEVARLQMAAARMQGGAGGVMPGFPMGFDPGRA